MLRLALAATLMYSATALTYNGDFITIYTNLEADASAIPLSATECDAAATGVAAGPVESVTENNGSRWVLLGNCMETSGAGAAGVSSNLPMNNVFAAATGTHEAFTEIDATEVSFAVSGTDVKMSAYTGAANDCASTIVTAGGETSGDGSTGWQCRSSGTGSATTRHNSISMGIAAGATNAASAAYVGANYVTVGVNTAHSSGVADCTTPDTTVARNADVWPVCANDADCTVGSCSTATTASAPTWNYSLCTGLSTPGAWTPGNGNATKAHWGLCGVNAAAMAGSWQLKCDLETGNLIHKLDANATFCAWDGTDVTINFAKGNKCECVDGTNSCTASYTILNSDTEWDAICSIPAHTTARKYFKGYLMATQGDCDTHTDALSATATEQIGTKDVFMDTCYTMETTGQWQGWQGTHSASTGATEMTAGKQSYMFKLNAASTPSGHIDVYQFSTHDCSGATAAVNDADFVVVLADDDPAGSGWCQTPAAISHGAIGTSGNGATQLKTAVNYITVRKHTDTIASTLVGLPGSCLGETNVTQGSHLDYVRIGTDAADGCHQSAAATSYSWWCNTADGSINYSTYDDATCGATTAGEIQPGALRFTQLAYDVCTEADAADTTTTCTAAGPTVAACTSSCVEPPSAFSFATALTIANGATGDFGGKCLTQAANVSWEIISTTATWDAVCSAPTPAPTTATSTSGAGKIAATAAAAAAAAALLL